MTAEFSAKSFFIFRRSRPPTEANARARCQVLTSPRPFCVAFLPIRPLWPLARRVRASNPRRDRLYLKAARTGAGGALGVVFLGCLLLPGKCSPFSTCSPRIHAPARKHRLNFAPISGGRSRTCITVYTCKRSGCPFASPLHSGAALSFGFRTITARASTRARWRPRARRVCQIIRQRKTASAFIVPGRRMDPIGKGAACQSRRLLSSLPPRFLPVAFFLPVLPGSSSSKSSRSAFARSSSACILISAIHFHSSASSRLLSS